MNCYKSGVFAHDAARATLLGSDIFSCHMAGVELAKRVVVETGWQMRGAVAFPWPDCFLRASRSSLHVRVCVCTCVSTEARGELTACRIYQGVKGGLFVYDNSEATVVRCQVFGNALSNIDVGVKARSASRPVCQPLSRPDNLSQDSSTRLPGCRAP